MLLNLLQLLQSDDQTTYTDKVNYNFDQILSMGGGPIGPTGFQGIQGVPGAQGIQGFQGLAGIDGSRWYVLPSISTPTTPTPKIGDLWLQTDTLAILEYLGSPAMWVNLGFTLASTGVFSSAGANNLVFTSPSPLRSLVLSPINYGTGVDSPGAADYRLKIVTSSGSPMIRFAVDDAGAESSPTTTQPTISVQKINDVLYPSSTNWRLNVEDLNGDIFLNLNGNYLGVYPQISSVSRFDFGAQTRLQNNATDRLLSFAVSNTGTEFFHIGRHTGIAVTSDRLFSIKDNGQISIGDAFSNPIGATNYHIDSINDDLPKTGSPPPVDWLRLRGKVQTGGTTWDSLNINHNRLFNDSGSPAQRSTMIRVQHQVNASLYHFVGFTGGADSAVSFRPQLRLGYANGYYLSADINGRIGIGNTAFIQKYNSGSNIFQPKLTVQGNSGAISNYDTQTAWSGIHLIPTNAASAQVGITAGGIGTNENSTFAGMHFVDQTSATDQGLDIAFTASLYSGGLTKRYTIGRGGDHTWHSKGNANFYLLLEPGGYGSFATNDFMHISAYDQTAGNSWKDILFNRGTDFTGYGNGFVGIGGDIGFGDLITGSINLASAQEYVALTACAYTVTPFVGFPYSGFINAGDIFSSVVSPDIMNLDSGTVSRAKPYSKLHVNESVTFGTRLDGLYSFVGTNSFTVGNTHRASGLRSIILGGVGHNTSGTDGIIIGYSGTAVTMTDANKVLLATTTHVSTAAPSTLLSSVLYTAGEQNLFFGVPAQYTVAGSPILNPSIAIQTSALSITGQVGKYGSVITLEGRTDTTQLDNVAVAMEFHIKNSVNTKRLMAAISAQYFESSPGIPGGFLSFALNSGPTINGASVGVGGALTEILRLGTGGLSFISTDSSFKPKITVQQNQKAGGAGISIFLTGGFANTSAGPAIGGNVFIDAGLGGVGGANGTVAIGENLSTNSVTIGSGGNVPTVTIKGTASASIGSTVAKVATTLSDLSLTGNLRAMQSTYTNFSVSSFNNLSGGAVLVSVADNISVNHGAGTNTTVPGLFSFVIDAVPYDRDIHFLGFGTGQVVVGANNFGGYVAGDSARGSVMMTIYRSPFAAGDAIERIWTTSLGGGNFPIPANTAVEVLMENAPFGITGARAAFVVSTGTHSFVFRQNKHGL